MIEPGFVLDHCSLAPSSGLIGRCLFSSSRYHSTFGNKRRRKEGSSQRLTPNLASTGSTSGTGSQYTRSNPASSDRDELLCADFEATFECWSKWQYFLRPTSERYSRCHLQSSTASICRAIASSFSSVLHRARCRSNARL